MRHFILIALIAGCGGSMPMPVEQNPPAFLPVLINPNIKTKVDLLFMVDNSNSMDSMQQGLRDNFYSFFAVFNDLAAREGTYIDFHIGVVTSDYGAGAGGAPGCSPSPGGQMGKLQRLGAKADVSCQPPVGDNFIRYAYTGNGQSINNLPNKRTLADTFNCMASVGSGGCGFEHQLESAYAALHNPPSDNVDFLRDDALLAVVFLTNEDDASAPPDTDVFDKDATAAYGYEDSYSRQTRLAVMCTVNGKPAFPPYGDSGGPLKDCVPAPNLPTGAGPGKQYDVSRYIDFFTKPGFKGGIKTNPLDVVLYGIDAPESSFQVLLSNPGTPAGQIYQQCAAINEASNPPCVPVLQHSCQAEPPFEGFFGDPAVRLNTVIRAAANHKIWSICDAAYESAMNQLALSVVVELGDACLPAEVAVDDTGKLSRDCAVADVTSSGGGSQLWPIPRCDGSEARPCWLVQKKTVCAMISPQPMGITIDRGGQPSPANSYAQIACSPIPR